MFSLAAWLMQNVHLFPHRDRIATQKPSRPANTAPLNRCRSRKSKDEVEIAAPSVSMITDTKGQKSGDLTFSRDIILISVIIESGSGIAPRLAVNWNAPRTPDLQHHGLLTIHIEDAAGSCTDLLLRGLSKLGNKGLMQGYNFVAEYDDRGSWPASRRRETCGCLLERHNAMTGEPLVSRGRLGPTSRPR
jgi:hypothetical protein